MNLQAYAAPMTFVSAFLALALTACVAEDQRTTAETREVAQAPASTPRLATATTPEAAPAEPAAPAASETAASEEEVSTPPELTVVSGRILEAEDKPVSGGVAWWIFQSRIRELPQTGALDYVKRVAEYAAAVKEDGSFEKLIAPGNYVLVYEAGAPASAADSAPGPESMAKTQGPVDREVIQKRIAAMRENAQKGTAIKDGKLEGAYVLENRLVRPPITQLGDMILGEDDSLTVEATDADGKPLEVPAILRLRGKNGDILEPHPVTAANPSTFVFRGLIPQEYAVFATAAQPAPGTDEKSTTPTIENGQVLFEGDPIRHVVTVKPGEE